MTKFVFATRSDYEPGLRKIEAKVKLKYIAVGWHSTLNYEVFTSALDIPKFGTVQYPYFSGNQEYLVSPFETKIVVRSIPQKSGGVLYSIDPTLNPNTFGFKPGGRYDGLALVGGSIIPNSLVPEVRRLGFRFGRTLTYGFRQIKDDRGYDWYVGPEALVLLQQEVRLVTTTWESLRMPASR